MRIDYHPEAEQELSAAVDWYLKASPSAASRFAIAIDRALAKIAANPERFVAVRSKFRACSLERFPYQVVFRIERERVFVIAVAHAKRRPGYWASRE